MFSLTAKLKENISVKMMSEFNRACETAMDQAVQGLRNKAFDEAPYRTGNLMRRQTAQTFPHGINTVGKLMAHATYSSYVHFGTRKMKANPWIQRSIDLLTSSGFFDKIWEKNIGEALNRIP